MNLTLKNMQNLFEIDEWNIIQKGYTAKKQLQAESIFSIGNGIFGQRANFEEKYSGPSLSDISWEGNTEEMLNKFKKGDLIKTKILDISVENEKISLGIKQLEPDPFADSSLKLKRGNIITCVAN